MFPGPKYASLGLARVTEVPDLKETFNGILQSIVLQVLINGVMFNVLNVSDGPFPDDVVMLISFIRSLPIVVE